MPSLAKRSVPDVLECFLGLQLSEGSAAYVQPFATAVYQALVERGGSVSPVRPEKRHVSFLYFKRLSRTDRAAVWEEVEVAQNRGAWKDLGFQWRGLELWPYTGVVLAAEKCNVLERCGLEGWLTHPICSTGDMKDLEPLTPHVTIVRLKRAADKTVRKPGSDEWALIRKQLGPIDPLRITADRLTFFLSDYSQGYHRYILEYSIKIA